MITDQPTNERQARGREMVEEFLHRFAEKADYRALACHAALPLMLTPELLKYLRHEFLPHLSWVAEVDLLLSKLCDEAAEGVYVMKRDARAYLIRRMREDEALGEDRIEIVNRILIERLDYLARNHPAILSHEWRTQRLSAMLYVTEQRDEAARELAETIYRCLTDNAGEAGKVGAVARRTELARLTRLVREEAANLQDDYPDLARLAQLIGQILADRSQRVIEDLRASGQLSQQFQLPGVAVRAPLLEYLAADQGGAIARDSKVEERVATVDAQGAVQSPGFKYSCYLNYHADAETANRFAGHFQNALTRELSSLGVDNPIFVASRNLESGPFYSESLTRALYESACYIALWSRVDQGNESLEREMESVRLLEKMRFGDSLKERGLILPVLLSAPESAPESLRNIQWVDFSKTITSPRWFSTKAFRSKIRDIAEFVLNRCREAERAPDAFADPQDFALQVEATDLMRQVRGAMNFGLYDEARAGLARALKIHRDRQDRDGEILALNDLGELSYSTSYFDSALRYYTEALDIARLAESRPHIAMLLDNLGLLYAATNESERALELYHQSLEIFRELGDKSGEAAVLGNLGLLLLARDETQQAIECFELQLKLSEETRYRHRGGIALGNLGVAYSRLGQSESAIAFYERAHDVFNELNLIFSQAVSLYQWGQELKKLGRREEAIVCAERALGLYEQVRAAEAEEARALLTELRSGPPPTEETPPDSILLSTFEFETVTLDERGEVKERRKLQARQFLEELAPNVPLAMVEIPGGKFTMGAPKNEANSSGDERPRHEVEVSPFFMGKFPITQAQWRVIAGWPKVKIDLKRDPSRFKPDSSRFKSDGRPVENVSWEEAKEFCARLTRKTGRLYRLPSEAEWEYACRAGTTTPFAFGETITHEIVNYWSENPYPKAKKAEPRDKTVPVGSLGVANAFGLFDIHGNVWEWCEDVWHDNYDGAPTDGSAWLDGADLTYRTLRGGSYFVHARACRSASREVNMAGISYDFFGFRVVVSAMTS